ncbi:MAG: hypothetical protein ACFFDB_02810 [Promethearchaeota archaeon]
MDNILPVLTKMERMMEIVLNKDIILELSELLTKLIYNLKKGNEYRELFTLLKNLYDSIGYYTYDELEPKEVISYSLWLAVGLKQRFYSLDDSRLIERVKDLTIKINKYIEDVHGLSNLIVVPEWPEGLTEKDQMERDIKIITWRFGSCLAICLRAGGSKRDRFIQFLFEFFDYLNKGLYSSQGISIIEENLSHFEKRLENEFDVLDFLDESLKIIKGEYNFTVNKLKEIFD